jgi:transcriptional repressor OPI1
VIGSRIERIKQDIVDTLRKAVDIVSKHAGSALPEPARHRVKMYILALPSRWAAANNTPVQSPRPENGIAMNGMTREEETGWRVLSLAGESLEMLKGVMNVVGDTLQSAEEWAGRFGRNKRGSPTASGVAQDPSRQSKDLEKDHAESMHIEGQ